MTAAEVEARRRSGYHPRQVIESDPIVAEALHAIAAGEFSPDDKSRYHGLCRHALQ